MTVDAMAAAWTIAVVVGAVVAVWLLSLLAVALWRARQVRLDKATEIRLVQMEASWRLHEVSRNAFEAMFDTARGASEGKE